MSKGHAPLKFMRKIHHYLGIFTTPALLFFAFTGAMQTFNLHETTQGSSYKPPAWIATLAQLHKKQDTAVPMHKMRPPMPGNGDRGDGMGHGTDAPASAFKGPAEQMGTSKTSKVGDNTPAQKSHLPMKIFFLLVAMSLALSTMTGVYMSYKYNRGWWQLTGLLVAGLVVPLLLLPF
jgi:hypothetical protein